MHGSPLPLRVCPVRQVRLVRGLQATEAWEQGAVSMEVKLSHDHVEGSWTRDGLRLQPGPTCQLAVHGPIHTLTLLELRPQDSGLIAFKAEGVHTSAQLMVTGAWACVGPAAERTHLCPQGGLGRQAGSWSWNPGGRALGLAPRISCVIPPGSDPSWPCSHFPPPAHLELPVRFSHPLQDMVATEKDKVTLECELSRPNVDVRWLKVPPSPWSPLAALTSHGCLAGEGLLCGAVPAPDPTSSLLRTVWSCGWARQWAWWPRVRVGVSSFTGVSSGTRACTCVMPTTLRAQPP